MTTTTTRDARGRFATITSATAEDVAHRPGTIVVGADGIRRTVRSARFGASSVVLIYTAGPSDTYRHGYVLSVVGPFRPYGA